MNILVRVVTLDQSLARKYLLIYISQVTEVMHFCVYQLSLNSLEPMQHVNVNVLAVRHFLARYPGSVNAVCLAARSQLVICSVRFLTRELSRGALQHTTLSESCHLLGLIWRSPRSGALGCGPHFDLIYFLFGKSLPSAVEEAFRGFIYIQLKRSIKLILNL